MKEYLISCISAVAFFSLIESLVLKGALTKILKSIISLISILIIIYPIVNLINYNFKDNYNQINEEYSSYLIKIEQKTTESEISSLLIKNGYTVSEVKVEVDNQNGNAIIKKINVKISVLGITENEEHININDKIKNLILENLHEKNVEINVTINGNEQ